MRKFLKSSWHDQAFPKKDLMLGVNIFNIWRIKLINSYIRITMYCLLLCKLIVLKSAKFKCNTYFMLEFLRWEIIIIKCLVVWNTMLILVVILTFQSLYSVMRLSGLKHWFKHVWFPGSCEFTPWVK